MDSENMNQTGTAELPWWNRVTPFSKYLALTLLVILPFAGFSLGYWYASPLPVYDATSLEAELSSTTESTQTSTVTRPISSRVALIAHEAELMERFGIAQEDRPRLYWAEDKSVPYTLVPYAADGLSMQVPYNAGWGAPYYQLTPYDRIEGFGGGSIGIAFGTLNPCPEGCPETGASAHDNVILFPAGSLVSLTTKFAEGECQETSVNEHVSGVKCVEQSLAGDAGVFVEGSQYTYKFTGCLAMDVDARKLWCPVFYESIRVE